MRTEPAVPGTKVIEDPVAPLWRGTVALRIVTFLFAAGVVLVHQDDYQRPWLAWVVLGVMAVWSAITSRLYSTEAGRKHWIVVVDLLLTCGLMATSLLIHTPRQLLDNTPLITTIWASVPAVAAGTIGGKRWGFTGGLVVGLSTYLTEGKMTVDLMRDVVLLAGAGLVVGMAATTARRASVRLAQALRTEAATAERERLARSIHDSVLQVLARVRKRGMEVGGEAAELAQLAGEQEIALRALVAAAPIESTVDGEVDVRPGLQVLATPKVQVSTPATQVMLNAAVAAELTSLVREALSNVDKHASGARAWVLLEDLGEEVVLSVRDDGPGIPDGRIADAEAEGRMGIAKSIRGRVASLGGTLELQTGPGEGTEWEVRVFRKGALT